MFDANKLCPGCFNKKNQESCPICHYDENQKRSPLILPHRTLLDGRYLAGRVLGKLGGFGITYLGWDIRLETLVAIKEYLPRDLAGRDFDQATVSPYSEDDEKLFNFGLEQFIQEARALAKFDHANVVRVRTFFEENDTAYLVMDYHDGVSLEEYRKQKGGKISPKLAMDVMMPILDGLREVHEKGFLHRDIKPQNIYLTKDGKPILLDFGSARMAMGERSRSLSVVLTPGFAPFEQYHRRGKQGPWTDVYSAGATLYALVTGNVPPEATERKETDKLVRPSQIESTIPDDLDNAIIKSLEMDSESRIQTVKDFQDFIFLETSIKAPGLSKDYKPPIVQKPVLKTGPIEISKEVSTSSLDKRVFIRISNKFTQLKKSSLNLLSRKTATPSKKINPDHNWTKPDSIRTAIFGYFLFGLIGMSFTGTFFDFLGEWSLLCFSVPILIGGIFHFRKNRGIITSVKDLAAYWIAGSFYFIMTTAILFSLIDDSIVEYGFITGCSLAFLSGVLFLKVNWNRIIEEKWLFVLCLWMSLLAWPPLTVFSDHGILLWSGCALIAFGFVSIKKGQLEETNAIIYWAGASTLLMIFFCFLFEELNLTLFKSYHSQETGIVIAAIISFLWGVYTFIKKRHFIRFPSWAYLIFWLGMSVLLIVIYFIMEIILF